VAGTSRAPCGGPRCKPAKEIAGHVLTGRELGGALDDHVDFSGSEVAEDAGQHRLGNLLHVFEGRERENIAALAVRFVVEGPADGTENELGAIRGTAPEGKWF